MSAATRRRRYTATQRREAVRLAREEVAGGGSLAEVARRLGMPPHTLYSWRDAATGRRRSKARPRPIEVVEDLVVAPPPRTLVVHGPAGLRIEGLDIIGVAELVRRLA
jgi:transposase